MTATVSIARNARERPPVRPPRGRALKILSSHPVQYHAPLFRLLTARGNDVEVGYLHDGAARSAVLDVDFGIEFAWDVDLLGGYRHRVFSDSRTTAAAAMARWAIDRHTPLLLMGWSTPAVWAIWLYRALRRAPTVVLSETTPGSFGYTVKPRWRTGLLRWLLQHSGAVGVIGARNRAFVRSMGVSEERCLAVPYSVDNATLAAGAATLQSARGELRRAYGLDPELPTFLFCGKLIEKKRPLQLLDAFLAGGLAGRAQLLYVGEGALRGAIEARAAGAGSVRVVGFLNQTQMPRAYAVGDVLCLPSDARETWGLVINEALACGRPVIVSDAVGCSDDLVGADNGWVVPLDDPGALVRALQAALADRDRWVGMGQSGRRRVAAHTYAAMATGIEAAIDVARNTT